MSSAAVSPPVVKVKALYCPNCGGPVELRGFAHTLSIACPSCHSVLDATTPTLQILQKVTVAQRIEPLIPLGSRGKFENTVFEAIGFQVRAPEQAEEYSWSEYVLFNPYKGFRYLSEYRGHWNFIRVQTALPEQTRRAGKRAVKMLDRTYTHFDSASAVTTYVAGEFPWRVRVGERAMADDYVSPPYMLSSEGTGNEITWSLGEYWTGDQIWRTFQLPGRAPRASGIYMNQPSPYTGRVGSAWRLCLWLLVALFGLAIFFSVISANRTVFEHRYTFVPGTPGEASFVTDLFELTGRPSNVAVTINTDLDNNWAYFNLALIDQDNGHAYDFGREVSYYHGRDSDGSWTEGSAHDTVKIPAVPAGRYYLRVEPELDTPRAGRVAPAVNYDLIVRRDVPTYSWFWIAALLLVIPPIVTTVRSAGFESARWRESDYAPSSSSSSGDD